MGILEGLKILDFSSMLPGPFATLMLADMGADIIHVTPKASGKGAIASASIEGTNVTATGAWLGRNKKKMSLNLKEPQSIAVIKKMVSEYDIILEQFRPDVMKKMGLGYETLKLSNPSIIYCSLSGYGQTGPLKMKAGHDINYLARSGLMSYSGTTEAGPVLTGMQIADVASGSLNCVIGILAAVYHREKTGQGQYVDVSMADGVIPFNGMIGAEYLVSGKEVKRGRGQLTGGSIYDFYETKDGEYISVGSLEPKFFAAFCNGIGCPDLVEGGSYPKSIAEVKPRIREIIRQKTKVEWAEVFMQSDACVEPVLSLEEALSDLQTIEREMVVEVEIPLTNGRKVRQIGQPIKFSACPYQLEYAGYPNGHHTEEILESLGYSAEDVKKIVE